MLELLVFINFKFNKNYIQETPTLFKKICNKIFRNFIILKLTNCLKSNRNTKQFKLLIKTLMENGVIFNESYIIDILKS